MYGWVWVTTTVCLVVESVFVLLYVYFFYFLHKNNWYCVEQFYNLLSKSVNNNNKDNNFYLTSDRYNSVLNEVKETKSVQVKQTVHYRWLKHNDMTFQEARETYSATICRKKRNPVLCYIWQTVEYMFFVECDYMKFTLLLSMVEEPTWWRN